MDFGGGGASAAASAAAAASQKVGGLRIFDGEANTTAEARGGPATTTAGNGGRGCVADIQSPAPAPGGRKQPQKHELGYNSGGSGSGSSSSSSGSVLALAQKCTRTAKNGREQQRAQKISDVIDQLKVTLDKANFSSGSSSKLHVLVSCESYLRTLREKIRCYEMEAKLREAARGHRRPSPSSDEAPVAGGGTAAAAARRIDNKMTDWAGKNKSASGRAGAPAVSSSGGSSRAGETDRMGTGDDCSSSGSSISSGSSSGGNTNSTTSLRRRRRRCRLRNNTNNAAAAADDINNKQPKPLYSVLSSSSDDDENGGGAASGGVLGIASVALRGASANNGSSSSSAADNGSSTGSDGDTGSSDSGGGSTSTGTTDSGSQGFTTDTTSRGFTTDSSFSGYTGSLGSGSADTGSADGGSEESEEGTASSRMRVVNYFDIFRLSNVPMAIADKGGALVDVNDAMRGFGRIHQDTVSTLTVRSLVAPESSQALQDAMSSMLATSSLPQDNTSTSTSSSAPPQQVGVKPFLANAGIGNRPTLLTVSLVYDESGEASAFHVALIPRTTGDDGAVEGGQGCRKSTEYDAEAPGVIGQKGAAGGQEEEQEPAVARKRSPGRTWDAGGQTKSQKRRAAHE